jgi:hypothetical protein
LSGARMMDCTMRRMCARPKGHTMETEMPRPRNVGNQRSVLRLLNPHHDQASPEALDRRPGATPPLDFDVA